MTAAIQIHSVNKSFGQFKAVQDLSFEVPQGSIYGFLGPNGAGKSTTLRMLTGLIAPNSGSIRILGKLMPAERSSIMQQMGCIIEKPDFYGYMTAIDNLKLLARASHLHLSTSHIEKILHRVGLQGRGQQKVKTYSHGMKQRLGLAQVLLHDPDIIMLDEPNTGLDPLGIIELRNILLALHQQENKTILFSSHILSEVQAICTDMVVIHKGKAVVAGKVNELLSQENTLLTLEPVSTAATLQCLANSSWQHKILATTESAETIQINIPKQEIPMLLTYLQQHQIEFYSADYKNELEAYFLKITQS